MLYNKKLPVLSLVTQMPLPVSLLKAYTQTSGGSKYCDALGGLADQDLVASRGGAGADPEQGIEGGLPRAAPVEAEHELIEVVLKVSFPQSVVDAQAPTLEI